MLTLKMISISVLLQCEYGNREWERGMVNAIFSSYITSSPLSDIEIALPADRVLLKRICHACLPPANLSLSFAWPVIGWITADSYISLRICVLLHTRMKYATGRGSCCAQTSHLLSLKRSLFQPPRINSRCKMQETILSRLGEVKDTERRSV